MNKGQTGESVLAVKYWFNCKSKIYYLTGYLITPEYDKAPNFRNDAHLFGDALGARFFMTFQDDFSGKQEALEITSWILRIVDKAKTHRYR